MQPSGFVYIKERMMAVNVAISDMGVLSLWEDFFVLGRGGKSDIY